MIFFIIHSFWERTLSAFKNNVVNPIQKEDYCFEFHDDDTNDIVPHYHGNRLMKDEYIDGFVYHMSMNCRRDFTRCLSNVSQSFVFPS